MYQRPMVSVYQEYESTSISTPTAQLPPCIVGPCFHILDPEEDEILALFGEYTKEGIDSGMFPHNSPGALIDPDSVVFRFKNAHVLIAGKCTLATFGLKSNSVQMNVPATCIPFIEIGDYANFSTGQSYRVIGVNEDEGIVLLNRQAPKVDTTTTTIDFVRKIESCTVRGDTPGKVLLDVTSERFTLTGITTEIKGNEYPILKSELYVGYRALRQDLSDITTIYSLDECKGQLGKIVPENPLAFGVSIALANTSVGIQCIGVDSEDLAGYTAAKDRLEQQDPVYAIVPLTFDTGVLSMFKMHCEEYSKPEVSKWRMAIGCTKLQKTKELCEKSKGMVSEDGDLDLVILTASDESVEFLSSSVDAGDTLFIKDKTGKEHEYTIASVPSEDILTITQSKPFDSTFFKTGTEYEFRIVHQMSREEQARWIRDASKAYGYCRYVNICPDTCIINDEKQPGYYLGCAVAAGIASLPSHYGMTRLSIGGISGVRGSGDYFNNDQLDIIADGGTFIFVQLSPSAPPYIRHQLTTDRSTVEFQELSFVKNFDYISYICRDVLDAFIGKWNINQETLGSLRAAVNGALETIKLDSQPKIGSRLLAYKVVKLEQLADVRDRVEIYAEVSMPYPLNTIGLHLKSVFLQISSS